MKSWRVGYYQFEPRFGDREGNLGRIARALAGARADLMVLPELCSSGYVFTSRDEVESLAEPIPGGPTTRALEELAGERTMTLVAGIPERDGDRFFNSAVLVSPGGYVGRYRKVHLFDRETLWFEPGDEGFRVHEVEGVRLGLLICFDWRFPEAARTLALEGADILCHPSNLVRPWCQDAMVTRSIENRVFSITANRTGGEDRGGHGLHFTGRSQVVSARGEVLSRAPESGDALGIVEISPGDARDKRVNERNDLFAGRRPEAYRMGG
jgi:predicted amidohydrolase